MTGSSPPDPQRAGPTDIADPLIRQEVKKAVVWIGIASLLALGVLLAQPLMVVFGGMVFGALVDGGARLLGRVAPLPRTLRVGLVLMAAVGFAAWVAMFAGSQITDQAAALPSIIAGQAQHAMKWAAHHGFAINQRLTQNLTEQALGGIGQITGVVGGLIGGATTLLLILVLGIYFALDPHPYQRGLAWMLPREQREYFAVTCAQMGHTLRRLLLGRMIGMTVEGLSVGFALWMGDVPMAALLGLITGLLAFLPNIGAPISGLLMVLVGFSGGLHMGLYCIAVYVVVQGIDGNIIVPMVAKKTADLAPALVLAMQLIMGVLFGILGLALADPLLAMLKVALERLSGRHETTPDEPELELNSPVEA